jgi:hypothetical protein
MKIYSSQGLVIVPGNWCPDHGPHYQANVVAVANTKNELDRMLTDAGAHHTTIGEMRVAGRRGVTLSNPVETLIAAGLLDCLRETLLVYRDYQQGRVITEVRGRTVRPVARFTHGTGLMLRAERLPETQHAGGDADACTSR